jgi:hypothetical protein
VGPEELYRYYKKVCQFLDIKEGESTVSCHVTIDPSTDVLHGRIMPKRPLNGGAGAREGPLKTCRTCSTTSVGNVQKN